MVLTTANKENVSIDASLSRRRDLNLHRQRSSFHSVGFNPSHTHATRDAARRASHSIAVFPPSRTLDLAAEDVEMEHEQPVHTNPVHKVGSLPRYLPRPVFRGISTTAMSAVDRGLGDVAIEFIHQKIRAVGQKLLATASEAVVKRPKGRLPRELEIIINDVSADAPTHLFAVYSQPSALQKQRISVHPVHALVFAANCANLPPLPYSKPETPSFRGSSIVLPVIPICIPSPSTFPILLNYLYTQRTKNVLASLLSLSPRDDMHSLEHLSEKLAERLTVPSLLNHVYTAQALWSNITALGVFDENLWRALEAAWEVLLDALALSSGTKWSK